MRSVVLFAVLALAAALVVPRYAARIDAAAPAPVTLPAQEGLQVAAAAANTRSIVVPRDARGHFRVDARVDGRPLSFVVDTGATTIALSVSDAAWLGIHPAPREFVVAVRTANGTVRAAPTRLDTVEIGDLMLRDVAAVVLPDQSLGDNLLGLSFLSRLRRFEYSDGKLLLEQ